MTDLSDRIRNAITIAAIAAFVLLLTGCQPAPAAACTPGPATNPPTPITCVVN